MSAIIAGNCKQCKRDFYVSLGHPRWFDEAIWKGKTDSPEYQEFLKVRASGLCTNCYRKREEIGMDEKTLDRNFIYHAPKKGQPRKYEAIRGEARIFAQIIHDLCPESREQALAFTNLEQAVMWANAAIAREAADGD